MPGSRVPGPIDGYSQNVDVRDGTAPLIAMPGSRSVGLASLLGRSTQAAEPGGAREALQATLIDGAGVLTSTRVKVAIASTIERGPMQVVRGIIVHQTGGASAQSSLDSYKSPMANGAHFLIDKDGTIYQTASLHRRTWHVGKLKARCLIQQTCTPAEIKAYAKFDPSGMNKREMAKAVPDRFPSNEDRVGIELIGAALSSPQPGGQSPYETVTDAQNASLKWLIGEIARLLGVPMIEIFRHPQVSWKNSTEASTAKWQ